MHSNSPYKATSETLSDFFHYSAKPEIAPSNTENKFERGKPHVHNKDLLLSGNTFIKGSNYTLAAKAEKGGEEVGENGGGLRYFDDLGTVRCRRCKALGHTSFTCPSASVCVRTCIYCSSSAHDQFDCPNKMCYRCNRLGHKLQQCVERRVSACERCGNPGHRAVDCVIDPKAEDTTTAVCMCCGKIGHVACQLKTPRQLPWEDLLPLDVENREEIKAMYEKRKENSKNIHCCYCGDVHRPSKCTSKPEISPQCSEAIRSRIRQREDRNRTYVYRRSSSRERCSRKNNSEGMKPSRSRYRSRSRSRSGSTDRCRKRTREFN